MPLRSMPCVPLCGISGVVERAHSTGPVVLAAKCLPFRSAAALLAAPASFGGRLFGGAQTSCKTDQQALHDALRELPGVTPPSTGSSFPSSLSHSVSTLSSLSCDLLKHLMISGLWRPVCGVSWAVMHFAAARSLGRHSPGLSGPALHQSKAAALLELSSAWQFNGLLRTSVVLINMQFVA